MAQKAEKMLLKIMNEYDCAIVIATMIVQCATFSKSLNPRNIDKTVSDIRVLIRFSFESSFWISGCKLTILPDIQPANRIGIISAVYQRLAQCALPYFAIQIQSWFFKTQSKSNHSPKTFSNVKSKSKWSLKNLKNSAFSQQNLRISFPLTQSKSGTVPKFLKEVQSGSNPNSTKFAIVRCQAKFLTSAKFLTCYCLSVTLLLRVKK